MDKKVFEMYEAPAMKVVELNIKSTLLVGSTQSSGGVDVDVPGDE